MIHELIGKVLVDLKESTDVTYKYSSTQIEIPHEISEKVLAFTLGIPEEKIYINPDPDDHAMGRELHPHVTIKYGLETNSPEDVEKAVGSDHKPIKVRLGKLGQFESEEHDVLKIDVVSEDLAKLNALLSKLPNGDKHPNYKPHLTIAYVKKGQAVEYVGGTEFEGTTFEVDWFYFKSSTGHSKKIDLKSSFNEEIKSDPQEQGEDAAGLIKGTNAVSNMIPYQ